MTGAAPVVLVTGGAGAIGRAIVHAFSDEGCRVAVADVDHEEATRVADAVGPLHTAHGCDVSDAVSVGRIVDEVRAEHGRIDTVVHSAGILGETPGLWDTSAEEWDHVFAVNTRGTFLVLRATGPVMAAQGSGCFIALASVAAKEARHEFVPYNASKAAVLNLVWSAALQLAPSGVRVHALCPGPVDTPMWGAKADAFGPGAEEVRQARIDQIPAGRFASPHEVAALALFLASPRAAYLTGLSIDVAGGARLGMGS